VTLSRVDLVGFVVSVIVLTPVLTAVCNVLLGRRYVRRQASPPHVEEDPDRVALDSRHEGAHAAARYESGEARRAAPAVLHRVRRVAHARAAIGHRALVGELSSSGPPVGVPAEGCPRGHTAHERALLSPPPPRRPPARRRGPIALPPHRPFPLSPGPSPPPPGPSPTAPTRRPQPARTPEPDAPARARDRTIAYLALLAAGLSVSATAYFYHRGQLVLYDDEFSRMSIARRTFENPSGFSLAQLGGVWLPWPQLLMMPFVAIDALYFDGIGGSIPSMLSYVACAVLIYKIVYHLTGARRAPAIAGASIFMLGPNVLYMQSTALSELCMFVWLLAGIYGVQRFFEVERPSSQRRYLALAGASCALALLTRYEGWIVTAALLGCVLYGCARRGDSRAEIKAYALAFAFLPALALAGWLAYNQVIFGSALYFYDGPYAKPSLWSSAADPAVGNWFVSAKTYLYAILDDTNWPTVLLALAGILTLAWRRRLAAHTLPVLSLLALIPFFVWSLHGAQRPMHVPQINHSLYNTRFALVYVPAMAIYIGYLIGALRPRVLVRVAGGAAIGAAAVAMVLAFEAPNTRITTLEDNLAWSREPVARQFASAAAYLRAHYRGGLVLAQFFGNEGVLYEAHITPGVNVYEGTHRLWLPAIADPAGARIQWIVMRTNAIDLVYRSLHGSRRLHAGYRLVYDRREYQIYRRRGV
jgi:hypothetical protein